MEAIHLVQPLDKLGRERRVLLERVEEDDWSSALALDCCHTSLCSSIDELKHTLLLSDKLVHVLPVELVQLALVMLGRIPPTGKLGTWLGECIVILHIHAEVEAVTVQPLLNQLISSLLDSAQIQLRCCGLCDTRQGKKDDVSSNIPHPNRPSPVSSNILSPLLASQSSDTDAHATAPS